MLKIHMTFINNHSDEINKNGLTIFEQVNEPIS